MQTLEHANGQAADLYWLAFLLTGHRETSADVAMAVLDSRDGGNHFFSEWMHAWARRLVIAKALPAIREELAASARRTQSRPAVKSALPPRTWALRDGSAKVEVERALLAIDVFPRCVLLLSIFEGMALADVATLLDSERELVRKAQMIGLRELTRNLAGMQGWTPAATAPYVVTTEMQHA
jgi:DNA-directed RNA polymerase specialized sigma24 family protein